MAHEALVADLGRLRTLFDEHGIRGGEPAAVTDADVAAVDEVLPALNDLLDRQRLLERLPLRPHEHRRHATPTRPGSSHASRPTWPGSAR